MLILSALFIFLLFLDFIQTTDIKNHQGMEEVNPLLGKHPSDARIKNYFIIVGLVWILLAYNFNDFWQGIFVSTSLLIEGFQVIKNWKLDLGK